MKSNKFLDLLLRISSKIFSIVFRRPFDLTLLEHNGCQMVDYPESGWLLIPFPKQKSLIYNADNLATANRAYFLKCPAYQSAKNEAESRWVRDASGGSRDITWRLHVFLWAIECAINQKKTWPGGIFVECGTGKGFMAAGAISRYGAKIDPLFLIDTFESSLVTNDVVLESPADFAYADDYDEVYAYFSEHNGVNLLKGFIPHVLEELPKEGPILFLHIDLNNAEAEAFAIERLAPRLVEGSIVLFDDYGGPGGEEQAKVHRKFANRLGLPLLELPTGQALILYK